MAQINDDYLKLPGSYLFADIAHKVNAFKENHPEMELIRLGIGDVTRPLPPSVIKALHKAVDEQATAEGFRGYGPEQGYRFLREAIAQGDFASRGVEIDPDDIFVSDGAKCDLGNFQELFGRGNVIAVTDPEKSGDERLSAFWVPMDAEGFELVPMPHMMGCRGAGHAGFKMTNVTLPPKCLLGAEGEGMKVAMHSLAISRVHIADSNLGMCQRMLEISIARARDRVTFGKPIMQRQAIKMKLANMATMIHALRCMVIDFAEEYEKDPMGEYIAEKAAMCKLFSIDCTRLVSDEMLEIFGGDGYFEDSPYGPTERLYRDCRAMWLEEGAPTVQRITIARELDKHNGVLEYPESDWIAGTNL